MIQKNKLRRVLGLDIVLLFNSQGTRTSTKIGIFTWRQSLARLELTVIKGNR